MKGQYRVVVGKTIKDLIARMAKYEIFTLGGIYISNGVYTQSFTGDVTKEHEAAQEAARELAVKKEAELKVKYAAKRKEQAEAKKNIATVSPRGKNFKKGSPIDRDFQDAVARGEIDSNGNRISPRAQLTAKNKADKAAEKTKAEKKAGDKKATANLNPDTKSVEKGDGYAVVEGVIPDDMK